MLAFLPWWLAAQGNVLSVTPPAKITVRKSMTAPVKIIAQLRNGYHVNSNTPSEAYLIPLRLTWTAAPLELDGVEFPKPKMEKYEFSDKPLSVFTGDFEITSRFKVPANAPSGVHVISGKLRYQACSHKECLPPRTIDVKLPVDIAN